jgi:crotonobetaine/carnitine-CoA ligase
MATDLRTPPLQHARTGAGLWRRRVEESPDAGFLVQASGEVATFAETDDRLRRVATGLAALGIGRGTRVAVGMANSAAAFWVHAAVRELGAVIVPLVTGLAFPELAFQLEHSQARALVAAGALAEVLLPRADQFPRVDAVLDVDSELGALLSLEPRPPQVERPGAEDEPWAILYTSGSTGRPKGVVLPAGAFVTGGWGYAERFGLSGDDTYVVATSMAHAVGGLTEPSGAIHVGARLAVLDHFSPSRFWDEIDATGGTVTIVFPAQLNLLLGLDSSPAETTLRLVITHAYIDAFRERFGVEVGVCWGMTETGAGSTGSAPGYHGEYGEQYVGRPMAGVELALHDGEICLRTRHQMLGYLDDPDATAITLAGGWVHSGDTGRLDEDGGLHFQGRIKNMIKRAGENISPEEIERAIASHKAVREAIVVSVPDPIRTEEAAAVVTVRDGLSLPPDELIAFLSDRLAAWKLPRYVRLQSEPLPRLPGGKLDGGAVRAALDPSACWDRELSHGPRDAVARLLGGTVTDWRQLVAGNSRTTWAAEVRRGDQQLSVVARVDAGDGPFSGTPYTLAREATIYRALQGRGVALPAIHGFDARHMVLALGRAAGQPAWDDAVLDALLRELRALHAIDPDTLELDGIGAVARAELELWAQMAATRSAPASPFVEFAVSFLRARFPGEPARLSVVHGDPGPGNLLWAEDRITALLDWEMSHLGDSIDDLAFLTVRLAMFGIPVQGFGEHVRAHYGPLGADAQRRLRYWQAVSVLRNLIICLSSVSNPVRGRERLVHWMLIPSLARLLTRALATLDGIELPAPEPAPSAPALPGGEVLKEIAAVLDGLPSAIDDPEQQQRARRARHLMNQLAETWTLAPQVAARHPVRGPSGEIERLHELAADADRQLWLFPRARALGEAVLPGFA